MTEPEVPDRRPLVYAAMGILIVGIATILFWPRPSERGPDSLVLTPQDATAEGMADAAVDPARTALRASDEAVETTAPPSDAFTVENAQLNEETVIDPPATTPPVELAKAEKPPASTPRTPAASPTSDIQPASAGQYLLNVGSFSERANAASMAEKLEEQGIPARVVASYTDGKTRYRVQVGYFEGFSLADAYGKQLRARAGVDYWVGQR